MGLIEATQPMVVQMLAIGFCSGAFVVLVPSAFAAVVRWFEKMVR